MQSMFLDETNIKNLKDVQKKFNFKDDLYDLKELNTLSTHYESLNSVSNEFLSSPKTLTEDNFSFINDFENSPCEKNDKLIEKTKYENNNNDESTKLAKNNFITNNNVNLPEQVINKVSGEKKNEKYYDNVIINEQPINEILENTKEIKQTIKNGDLNKIMNDIYFLCFHKNGCEYIIKKLKENDTAEKQIILNSLLIDPKSLCPDMYGSYVAQSVFDLKDEKYKERFTDEFLKHTSFLTLHTYGCRLIQKSLESLSNEYKCKIFKELEDDLITYICHQNGNHVVQKCVEVLPSKNIDTIINIIEEYLSFLSSHAYGCRIVQRIYEIGTPEQINRLNDKIIKKIHLIKNRYGNYVIQKCFEYSDDNVRLLITNEIVNDIYKLSSHKYACNIIEKILLKKEYKYKKKIIKRIVDDIPEGNDNIISICKDCYGNFMMQKLLTTCKRKERNLIVKTIIENLDKLKEETYGKYILRAINNLES
ncbi:hypothetical protein YYC_05461 [Plasmodium yoelii 17X]|uniref:mRNA-binding protein PUF2 n=3 Tax=Plasmodium yoelii TaxID=5861 RepID=A0AAE9WQ64_PLAYO|nr:mRNA-binding protein PUF2 [Plasmodium yoelii]ETB56627.1 hypothetical protein YYC_05461 [Plasmodium yoelii 17X]WBY56439.1 mRNA-binding protein PUF2 [Plasmodium yoelii yoelii]CDU17313.1 mRNA-binding protein PUF2 [Plasmodium yoelii]VTZ76562.1 mRNA-binding protein PUF2 [Plasmodium yoelii]|eukprot:XP_022811837.1 mRNA-binding protein PUF2 [Plasmodium yoelii]